MARERKKAVGTRLKTVPSCYLFCSGWRPDETSTSAESPPPVNCNRRRGRRGSSTIQPLHLTFSTSALVRASAVAAVDNLTEQRPSPPAVRITRPAPAPSRTP